MPDVESRRVLLRAWLALPMLSATMAIRAAPALLFDVELRWVVVRLAPALQAGVRDGATVIGTQGAVSPRAGEAKGAEHGDASRARRGPGQPGGAGRCSWAGPTACPGTDRTAIEPGLCVGTGRPGPARPTVGGTARPARPSARCAWRCAHARPVPASPSRSAWRWPPPMAAPCRPTGAARGPLATRGKPAKRRGRPGACRHPASGDAVPVSRAAADSGAARASVDGWAGACAGAFLQRNRPKNEGPTGVGGRLGLWVLQSASFGPGALVLKLALIAHDGRKDAMLTLAGQFLPLLRALPTGGHGHHGRTVGGCAWADGGALPVRGRWAGTCRSGPSCRSAPSTA